MYIFRQKACRIAGFRETSSAAVVGFFPGLVNLVMGWTPFFLLRKWRNASSYCTCHIKKLVTRVVMMLLAVQKGLNPKLFLKYVVQIKYATTWSNTQKVWVRTNQIQYAQKKKNGSASACKTDSPKSFFVYLLIDSFLYLFHHQCCKCHFLAADLQLYTKPGSNSCRRL